MSLPTSDPAANDEDRGWIYRIGRMSNRSDGYPVAWI